MKTQTMFAGELGFVTVQLKGKCPDCGEATRWEGDYCRRHEDAHMCSKCGCIDCAEHTK